jgi:hypothetical protein
MTESSQTRHDLEAVMETLNSSDAKARRDFEGFIAWAHLKRDWITDAELEHLKRGVAFAAKRNRSLTLALERTKPVAVTTDTNAAESAESQPPTPPADLAAMARELHALRTSSEAVRQGHEQVALKLKTEFSYQAAWERRLEHAEDEVRALWDLVAELVRLTGVTAPRLEKLERRVGFQFLRRKPNEKLTRKPVGR